MAHPASVISPDYCAPRPVHLTIVRKVSVMSLTSGKFDVIDVEGNVVFKVKEPFGLFHGRSLLLDAAGNPIVTLIPKANSWKVFRGDITNSGNMLLFGVKQSPTFQFKTTLNVFLANNTREDVCDFKVERSFSQQSYVIYAGNSSRVVAQMHKEQSMQSLFLRKDKFMVTVNPNIDYAFIVALIVILDKSNEPQFSPDPNMGQVKKGFFFLLLILTLSTMDHYNQFR